ncbi:Stk1 family PASTA domain-containing Ser/Thr kinase [Ornithinibacillus bavariensis]|uniref:Serine/threonine-protein kinase PrkC n=1 Tax=Ornithinibacillus bavariensis TaxID=545502 RepID=A0A919X5I3_9BACI|nr:Stk1 family PASTA domain-containing Ser/Thr kinase [Ornithinibacillus bavariensis]GIO26104.1 serine/threonine-protein kinase PrkC [Ornithinibacillus bavariensis]
MLKGHLLDERYRIIEKIGGGGMADVYLADDTILDRKVAIKVLRLEYANDEEFIARFDREAQSATSLSHPNIVSIFDVGEEDQILYMVMEYVDGMTLKEFIQKYGPLDVTEAINIMKQITAAITHAHENGIVHRDIKPQNILIDTYGHIKVTDFGIAIALSATSLTQTNSILGSVHYLSPEQARGGLATKKSDIYSLGIVLFEMLTGRLPFSGQSPVSIALKHLQSETPSVRNYSPDVPQSVENIVLKATAKDPFHRYNTVYDMEESLEVALLPENLNEPKYVPPEEVGEETKAIPIITESNLANLHQDTIVHQTNGETKKVTPGQAPDGAIKKKIKKKKKRNKKWLIISIVLFALLAILLVTALVISATKPKDVKIPDVIGWEFSEAEEELELNKLKVAKEEVISNDVEEGLVVRTDPRPGRTVKEDSTITVFVSKGKEKIEFGNYVGQQIEDVKRILDAKKYKAVIVYEEFSDRPVGEILKQIEPEPGEEVIPEETSVIFEVSKGKEPIKLNNLEGLTEAEAREYLESNGLRVSVKKENSESVPMGHVIRQDPNANSEVNEGDTVVVYISIGPKELPPRSHTVQLFIKYTGDDNNNEEDHENKQPSPQKVRIYIEDMVHKDIAVVYEEFTITDDVQRTIDLKVAPKSTARYRVLRDDEVIYDETIPYEEGE